MSPPTKLAEAGVQDSQLFTSPGCSALTYVQKASVLESLTFPFLFSLNTLSTTAACCRLVFVRGLRFLEVVLVIVGGLTSVPFHDSNPS